MSLIAPGNLVAFDYGLKYIGVAIGQTITGTCRGVTTMQAKQGKPRWRDILTLIDEYIPVEIIVGHPLNMDGTTSEMADLAANFASQLAQRSGIDVSLHDERLTSKEAKELFADAKALGQAATEHELAACLILSSYMEERRKS